jgi:flavin reductase (DIM6/NTAB) family NADH-FMN oxidoreductase RutF
MMRTFPAADLSAARAYSLMVGIVVPRPVAWITTINAGGMVNAAPFSCYTFVCNQTPILAVSIGPRGGGLKDTAANIGANCRFVVNVATEETLASGCQLSRVSAHEASEGARLRPSPAARSRRHALPARPSPWSAGSSGGWSSVKREAAS